MKIAVANSGGVDSSFLLHKLLQKDIEVHSVTVNHNFRPLCWQESDLVKHRALDMGVHKAVVLNWHYESGNKQGAARVGRYTLMGEYCRNNNINCIFLGHHRDDQLENTVMSRGLMKEITYAPVWPALKDIFLVRPNLNVSKDSIYKYCFQNNIPWVEDDSNKELKYSRNFFRRQLLDDRFNGIVNKSLEERLNEDQRLKREYNYLLKNNLVQLGNTVVIYHDVFKSFASSFLFRCAVRYMSGHKVELSKKAFNKVKDQHENGRRKFDFGNCNVFFCGDHCVIECADFDKNFENRMKFRFI